MVEFDITSRAVNLSLRFDESPAEDWGEYQFDDNTPDRIGDLQVVHAASHTLMTASLENSVTLVFRLKFRGETEGWFTVQVDEPENEDWMSRREYWPLYGTFSVSGLEGE